MLPPPASWLPPRYRDLAGGAPARLDLSTGTPDEARHGRRDAAWAAVVDVGGEVHAGQDARPSRARGGRPGEGSDVYVGGADVRVRVPVSNSAEMFNPDSHIPGYGAKNGHSGAA